MKNLLIVMSGPSGVGKGTIVRELMKKGDFALSVSCTTRKPRESEIDGVSYFFITKKEFEKLIGEEGFLEYNKHFENYYGTPKKFVQSQLESKNVILEIDVDGALQVKKSNPEAILIMIAPPDKEALRSRLQARGSENKLEIEKRIARMEYELSLSGQYDYVVINDVLAECVKKIEQIILKEKEKYND